MSVVIAKSSCLFFPDSTSLLMLCLTAARIMLFGQPGHHVTSDFVVKFGFIICF